MRPVTVVTDTTAYLPPGVAESNQLELVSLYVNHGTTRTVREIDMVDLDSFYDEMRSAEELPTTSQPSVGDFTQAYEPLPRPPGATPHQGRHGSEGVRRR